MSEPIGHYRNQNEDQRRNQAARRDEECCEKRQRHELPTALICQQHAAEPEDCADEKRIGEITDEKVSAADLEIVLHLIEVPIADDSSQRWNDADDGVGREDCRPPLA